MTFKRKRAPVHPGSILREITFPAMKVTISQAAREMSVSRQSLHKILAGERAITPEMAVRLGKFCGNGLVCGYACRLPMTCGQPSRRSPKK